LKNSILQNILNHSLLSFTKDWFFEEKYHFENFNIFENRISVEAAEVLWYVILASGLTSTYTGIMIKTQYFWGSLKSTKKLISFTSLALKIVK
jgi:hypothetical protein